MKDLGFVPGGPAMPPMGGKPPADAGSAGGPPAGWTPPMADVSWVTRKFLDVPYAHESPAQSLDLYLPDEGSGPFPLFVHIHGGGFAFGDKRDDHMDAYLKFLARGFAVASLEYRVSGEAKFPAAVLDCRQAIRFLRAHADEYSIDADAICALGGSAGGNLSAMLGMNVPNGEFPGEEGLVFDVEPKVVAAVDQFGPVSFKTMDDQARANGVSIPDHDGPMSPESSYLGVCVADAPQDLVDAANPATYASPAMAPLLVQHGTVDHLVPFEQSVELVATLRDKGFADRVEFVPLTGADHEDKMFTEPANLDVVEDFLRRGICA